MGFLPLLAWGFWATLSFIATPSWALDCPPLTLGMGCELYQRTDAHGDYTLRLQYNRLTAPATATVLWLGPWDALQFPTTTTDSRSPVTRWNEEAAVRTVAVTFEPTLAADHLSVERYLRLLTALNEQQAPLGEGSLKPRIQIASGTAATVVALASAQQALPLQRVILFNGPLLNTCDAAAERCDEATQLLAQLHTRRRIPELSLQVIATAAHLANPWQLRLHESWFHGLTVDCKSRLILPQDAHLPTTTLLANALYTTVRDDPCGPLSLLD